jgi:hypothetical protein
MPIPEGYNLNSNGFYYRTDGSGPYSISPTGVVTLVGAGIGLGIDTETVQDITGAQISGLGLATVQYNDTTGAITVDVPVESIDDRVAALLVAGANVNLTYNDVANTLTIASTGGGGGATNLSMTRDADSVQVNSDTGTDADIPVFSSTQAGVVPASGGGSVNFLRADGAFAAPPGGGGGSLVVQENEVTVDSAVTSLNFSSEFNVTSAPAGEADVAIGTDIARILAPITISANTALTAAAHGNRLILVDTAGVVLTINNDATGGWTTDDSIDAQAIGAGTFTLVQGTATLTTADGASADSTTSVSKRVTAQRTGASAWRTISPIIVTGGSGNAPITLTANTTLNRATHGNRVILVSGVGLVMTVDANAGGGWQAGDYIDIQPVAIGTDFTVVAGGGVTITTRQGAANSIYTAVGGHLELRRAGADDWWHVAPLNSVADQLAVGNGSFDFNLGHAGICFVKTDANAYAWTIPDDGSVNFPFGTKIKLVNIGSAGAVTVTRGAGVALFVNSVDANYSLPFGGNELSITKIGTNQWIGNRG